MKIVILDGYTANPGDLSWDGLKALGDLTVYERTRPEETIARCKGADIVLTNKVVMSREVMEALPTLRYIGVLATGYNVVDTEMARECGIVVTNVPAYSTESVAQMVFSHLLTVTNRTEHYAQQNREGRWTRSQDFCYWDEPLTELAGKTMGVVGLGNIGSRVAQIAQAFDMKVKAMTSRRQEDLPKGVEKVTLQELLSTSDVVSLHCPLTETTHHLIGEETIKWMRSTTILINTGRGPLVDDEAVAKALKEERMKAYCADVMTVEPPKVDNPLIALDNAYITPHIAWASTEARMRLVQVAVDNVKAFVEGKPKNVV